MTKSSVESWTIGVAVAAALASAGSTGISAWQTFLLRQSSDDALIANLQDSRISICGESLAYLANVYYTQGAIVSAISSKEIYDTIERARSTDSGLHSSNRNLTREVINFYKQDLGENYVGELRSLIVRLALVFPDSVELSNLAEILDRFEFSLEAHLLFVVLGDEGLIEESGGGLDISPGTVDVPGVLSDETYLRFEAGIPPNPEELFGLLTSQGLVMDIEELKSTHSDLLKKIEALRAVCVAASIREI